MAKVLITGELPQIARQRLESLGLDLATYGAKDLVDENKFIEAIKGIDIYISGGYETGTAAVLEASDKLCLIVFLGVDCGAYIDLKAAAGKGIKVCNTPGANAISVAEFTVGLMIDAQRHISSTILSFAKESGSYETSSTMFGKTLGLIGFGKIAQRVAQMCAKGFDTKVQYWSRSGKKTEAAKSGAGFVELNELIATSDIISLHVPGESGVILDENQFGIMKAGVTIVNTSPVNLCSPKALLKALKADAKMQVAFDGFYENEIEENAVSELRKMIPERIIVTPHVAWRTFEADTATYEMAIESIAEFLIGKIPCRVAN